MIWVLLTHIQYKPQYLLITSVLWLQLRSSDMILKGFDALLLPARFQIRIQSWWGAVANHLGVSRASSRGGVYEQSSLNLWNWITCVTFIFKKSSMMHLKGLHKYKTPAKFHEQLFILWEVMHMHVWNLGPGYDLSSFDPYPIWTSLSPQNFCSLAPIEVIRYDPERVWCTLTTCKVSDPHSILARSSG
jgi:hypothetical protein